jgi:hypothetical protein
VTKLLSSDAKERPTAQELLYNPWIMGQDVSSEPLEESVENLRRFHRGRRRLKALMLAIMSGLANQEQRPTSPPTSPKGEKGPARKVGAIRPRDSYSVPAETLGSRRAAVKILDADNKVRCCRYGCVDDDDEGSGDWGSGGPCVMDRC